MQRISSAAVVLLALVVMALVVGLWCWPYVYNTFAFKRLTIMESALETSVSRNATIAETRTLMGAPDSEYKTDTSINYRYWLPKSWAVRNRQDGAYYLLTFDLETEKLASVNKAWVSSYEGPTNEMWEPTPNPQTVDVSNLAPPPPVPQD